MKKREGMARDKQIKFLNMDPGKMAVFIAAVMLIITVFNINPVLGEPEDTSTQPSETSAETVAPSETGTDTNPDESEPAQTDTGEPDPTPGEQTQPATDGETTEGQETAGKTPAPGSQTPSKSPAASPTKTPDPIPTRTPRPTDPPLPSVLPTVPTVVDKTPTPSPVFDDVEPGGDFELQKDMHGYIIRIAGWWDELKTNKNIEALVKDFEKKYNCQVLFMDMTQKKIWDKLLESRATGRPYIDAVFLEAHDVLGKMVSQGLLAPINPYYTEKELSEIPESYMKILTKGKNLYAVPAKAPNFSGIWCNVDYLTSLKVPDINKLYLNNEWTWEAFNKFMYNTTIDADNTGYYDRFGIAVGVDIYPGLIASAGGNIISWNGRNFTVDIHNTRTFSALEFARSIHTNGYVAYENEKFFYIYRSGFLSGESWMASKVKEYLKANNLFVPYPVPGKNDSYMALAVSAPVIALVETSMYKEETVQLIKLLYNAQSFEQEKKNAMKDFNKASANVYENMLKNFTVDFSKAFVDELSFRDLIMKDLKNRNSLQSQTIEQKYANMLNKAIEARTKQINLKRLPVTMDW